MTGSLLGPLDYMFGETLRVAVFVAVAAAGGAAILGLVRRWTFERAARAWLWVTSLAAIALFTKSARSRLRETGSSPISP